jgi:iron complex outermembrane receptor protein
MLPPQRIQTSLRYTFDGNALIRLKEINVMHTYMGAQSTVANLETPSAAYQVVDVAIGFSLGRSALWDLRVGCKNLLNEQYIDHLSRLKNIEMPAPGRNVYVSLNYRIKTSIK